MAICCQRLQTADAFSVLSSHQRVKVANTRTFSAAASAMRVLRAFSRHYHHMQICRHCLFALQQSRRTGAGTTRLGAKIQSRVDIDRRNAARHACLYRAIKRLPTSMRAMPSVHERSRTFRFSGALGA
jgi:hypothetical protein